jgi:flagellar protein FliO/FliZ
MDKRIRFSFAVLLCLAVIVSASAQATVPPETRQVAVPSSGTQAVDETTLTLPEAGTAGGTAAGTGSSSLFPYFLRMLLVLGLVIAAIYGLYALLRRGSRPEQAVDSYLRVLATASLGAGKKLHVVSLGDKAWLIGATESSINLVSAIDNKELVDALELRAAEGPQTPRKDFSSMLVELLGRKGSRKVGSADATDFFSRQRDRLKKF